MLRKQLAVKLLHLPPGRNGRVAGSLAPSQLASPQRLHRAPVFQPEAFHPFLQLEKGTGAKTWKGWSSVDQALPSHPRASVLSLEPFSSPLWAADGRQDSQNPIRTYDAILRIEYRRLNIHFYMSEE